MKHYFTQKEISIHFVIKISKPRRLKIKKHTVFVSKNNKWVMNQ